MMVMVLLNKRFLREKMCEGMLICQPIINVK
jgi:hypothetical protein